MLFFYLDVNIVTILPTQLTPIRLLHWCNVSASLIVAARLPRSLVDVPSSTD